MSREAAAEKIVDILDDVATGRKTVRYTSFTHPNGKRVTIAVFPTDKWDNVKWALEEVFGKVEEMPKLQ